MPSQNIQTVVAVFDTTKQADAAVKALKASGFADDDISVFDKSRLSTNGKGNVHKKGLWKRLLGDNVFEHEAAVYSHAIDHGGSVVVLRTVGNEVAHATGILDLHRPIDVHDRAITAGIAPAAHVETAAKLACATPLPSEQKVAVSPKLAEAHQGVLKLAEEQLNVGKKMVETGRTRVRRFVTERPVTKHVTLHEEHAEVIRKAVSDPKYVDHVDWADSTIEVVETAEHAVVNKTARIVEEVALRLTGSDHVETVHDKVRRQQVEIEHIPASGTESSKPTNPTNPA
ncbi:YsnF/AvaK domain-containing protein [Rhodoligotrophos defluvii]|uniref:YsnF/AvaK domain-containing protein n=1 Tax=Rhodoligotrophos defluvii TaxID=2561934 RepID=UPI0010CA05AA|nr:YsnF/AvaK domain-containing protein [Rhodoligotrophos defluvii]